jgi:hypothetical protein
MMWDHAAAQELLDALFAKAGGASIEFAVAKGVVEAAQAHESEASSLGDPDGAPATALEVVRQPPLEPKNAAGRQLNPTELRPVHGIPPFAMVRLRIDRVVLKSPPWR